MSHIPHIKSGDVITFYIKGVPQPVSKAHANYNRIVAALKNNDYDSIPSLINIAESIAIDSNGKFSVENGNLFYNGVIVHNAIAKRILSDLDNGFKVDHLCKFYENLDANPSSTSVAELYLFLEECSLPITPDGCFLAYKKVTGDYKDIYTGTIDNSVGAEIERLKRNQVDDKRENLCSFGYHVCSYDYLPCFGCGSGNRVMVCKVNPADVVSVPLDYNNAKMRVTFYEIVDEVEDWQKSNVLDYGFTDDYSSDEYDDDHADDDIEDIVEPYDSTQYKQVDLLTEKESKPDYTVKLNAYRVRLIDADMDEGFTDTQISNKYGISARQAGRIRSGTNWSHITGRGK